MNEALRRILAYGVVVVATVFGTATVQAQNEGVKQIEQLRSPHAVLFGAMYELGSFAARAGVRYF